MITLRIFCKETKGWTEAEKWLQTPAGSNQFASSFLWHATEETAAAAATAAVDEVKSSTWPPDSPHFNPKNKTHTTRKYQWDRARRGGHVRGMPPAAVPYRLLDSAIGSFAADKGEKSKVKPDSRARMVRRKIYVGKLRFFPQLSLGNVFLLADH